MEVKYFMARKPRTDRDLQSGKIRLSKVKSVEPDFKATEDVSVVKLEAALNEAQAVLDEYNQMLAALDGKSNQYAQSVKTIKDLSERLLEGVGLKYGKDSSEYEMAGGTRKSERKKPKPKTPPQSPT
jgi:hypothetical protein